MVRTVALAFCSIQQHFIRNICAKFGIPNLSQSPDIGQDSDGGISDFWISGQSLINSRTSNCTDMKLGPVIKLDKGNKATSKNIGNDVMSANCGVIVIFPIHEQFGAVWKLDS